MIMGYKAIIGQIWSDTRLWGNYQHLLKLTAGVGVPAEHSSGASRGISRVYPGVRAIYSLLFTSNKHKHTAAQETLLAGYLSVRERKSRNWTDEQDI